MPDPSPRTSPRTPNPSSSASLVIVIGLTLLAITPANAHDLNLFASVENGIVQIRAYHPGGAPLADAKISVRAVGNKVLATLTTDGEGRAQFTPPKRARYTFIAETDDGHRAYFALDPNEIPADLHDTPNEIAPTTDAQIEAAVSRQLRPLREQLDQLENTIRLRDLLGGIGYIVGVLGLLALIKYRRRDSP